MAATADKVNTSNEKKMEAPASPNSSANIDAHQYLDQHRSLPKQPETAGLHDMKIAGFESPKKASEKAEQISKTDKTEKPEPGKKTGSGDGTLPETQYTATGDETLKDIARQKLGKNASEEDVKRYEDVVAMANKNTLEKPAEGTKLDLPGRNKDGDFVYHNPEKKDEQITVHHKDFSTDAKNSKDGTSYHQKSLDDQSYSYIRDHHGPKPSDNYREAYFEKSNYTVKETKDKNGNIHDVGSDGTVRDIDSKGNWTTKFGNGNLQKTQSFDAKTKTLTTQTIDGSTIIQNQDSPETTTVIDREGTKTVYNSATDTQTIDKKDADGHDISTKLVRDNHGNYTLDGTGPKPADNFHETYDASNGQTIRTEGVGTPEEKTTTRSADGTVKVEAKNGDNYQRNPDGSEHHWGNKTFDKPPYDYKDDASMNQTRTDLDKSIQDHIPKDQQADFKKDMTDFEARAQKEHLPPDEITKTYAQMNRLLNAKDSDSVVPADNRAKLAEQLMHQTAHPEDTSQGFHETCNATTVAKDTLWKNPSKMAEVATSVALDGKFTAPDGKQIAIDKKSLEPGAEESATKPLDGQRSYATQVLNLALINDALQRRNPPETYAQRTPDSSVPGDTGERRLDASGKVINAIANRPIDTNGDTKWLAGPDNQPDLSAHDIASLDKSYNGDKAHVIDPTHLESGTEPVKSADQLAKVLQQYKDQGQLPVSIGVDANHPPIQDEILSMPGYGGHIVNITDYDPNTNSAKISNNWDTASNHWVDIGQLFENSSGNIAQNNNGVDFNWATRIDGDK